MNYHIAREGQQVGVFSEDEVRIKLQSGELRPSDLCWAEGMADWKPLSGVVSPTASSAAINPYAPPSVDVSKPARDSADPLASLGQRLGAALLDGLIAMVCAIPLFIGISMTEGEAAGISSMGAILAVVGGLALLALLVYNLVLLTTKGQTLGKKWVNIRIVTFDGRQNPGFVKAVLLRTVVNGLIGGIPFLGGIYTIVDICFIFREDHRCIHDLIAGTQVVQGSP